MGEWHSFQADKTLSELGTRKGGLSSEEAEKRLEEHGFNELKEERKRTLFEMFISQFASFLIFVLIAAAVIAALLGEWIDAAAIAAILTLNAGLGTMQEYRAEKAMEALRKMIAPTALVLRNGKTQMVPARTLVPGDVVILDAGTIVPADVRLIETAMLATNEASLTGESKAVTKDANASFPRDTAVAGRANMAFSGTNVVRGRGEGVVVSTGMATEFGKIATAMQAVVSEETPLRKSIEKLAKQLTIVVLAICAIVFIMGVLRGFPPTSMFLTSVSLAVAAIPEGLPAVITVALALGVQRMSRRNAIVRRLLAVETLGSANVICVDKTGTITKNEMSVRAVYAGGKRITVEGSGYSSKGRFLIGGKPMSANSVPELEKLIRVSLLCNNSDLAQGNSGSITVLGDPTEASLLVLGEKAGIRRQDAKNSAKFIEELPFDSERKMMSVVYEFNGKKTVLAKGAPEVILSRCTHYSKGGKRSPLDEKTRLEILSANDRMAGDALRVLGFAERPIEKLPKNPSQVEQSLTFLGLVGMIDAPREEVPEAIQLCKQAGIEVVMITGDNEVTARAVAIEIGLLKPGDIVVNGSQLDAMSDKELAMRVEKIRIYARVSPEHKLRIVNAWKAHGKVVAMTGDGVNDAPALKRADIGIAMGVTGTDVTKEVSDVVLADDNFASIVNAVKEGRGIYDNIRKSIAFLLSGNIAELLIIFLAILMGYPLPLTAVQILWVNFVTDGLPALALAADPISSEVMVRKPRPKGQSIWHGMRPFLFDYSLLLTASALLLFVFFLSTDGIVKAQTIAFTTVIIYEKYQAFSCRSLERPLGRRIFDNKWLVLATALTLVLHAFILYVPALNTIFSVSPLSLQEWALIIGVGAIGFIYLETVKSFSQKAAESRKSRAQQ